MGNTSSSNQQQHRQQQHDDVETTETYKTSKVPKHLQPLKRKQTKKCSHSHNTIIHNNVPKKADIEETYNQSNPVKTLQVKPNNNSENLDRIYVDQSSSSPQLFRWTKGRRFQNNDVRSLQDISYPLPNDQTELDRHRVQFYIIRWAFESRHIVPPKMKQKLFEGIKVLDVGCGPGLWLGHPIVDMAQDFPKSTFDSINVCNLLPQSQPINTPNFNTTATITATTTNATMTQDQEEEFDRYSSFQLSSSSSCSKKQQDNLNFTLHNMVKDGQIPFKGNTFDYVQQSLTMLAYQSKDWISILNDLKRVTKPGGYIQLIEIDLYIQPLGEQGGLWRDQILGCLRSKRGIDPRIACQLKSLLTEIGLIEVETRFVSIPVGSWGLDIGNLWEQNVDAFLEAARPFLVDIMQVSDNQYRKDRKRLKEELKSGKVKAFNNIHVAWGKRPR